jgi:hypothetical protein
MKAKIDVSKLNRAVQKAFDATVETLSDAFDNAMTAEEWEWDGVTVRRNGDVVGSPRDIVDQEDLINSKVVTRSSDGNGAEFTWEAKHSLQVHEGGTTKTGKTYRARPWTEKAIEETDLEAVFARELKKQL